MEYKYKTLEGFEEIEVNEMGEVIWTKSKRPVPIYYNKVFNSYYVKYNNWDTDKNKSISMFNLMAKLFVDNPNGYKYVQTINGDNSDYKASNLHWVKARRRKAKVEEDDD